MTAVQEAIRDLRSICDLPLDPARRGPVPLQEFFENVMRPRSRHVALPRLTRGSVVQHLRQNGVLVENIGDAEEELAGFVFMGMTAAWAYVKADDPLPRRRFSAAHELGHIVLHSERLRRETYLADTQISESEDTTNEIEREANQFAAELLMPEEVIRTRAEELKRQYGACPRGVLEYRLAAELLVSAEAMRNRVHALRIDHA